MSLRARALALLGTSAICAGLAGSLVNAYVRDVRAQVGPLVPVLVARKQIPSGRIITPASSSAYLEQRRVPARFAPAHSFRLAGEAFGLRARGPIPAGSYLGTSQLAPPARSRPLAPRVDAVGARLVEVRVAGAVALRDALQPGTHVDVLITSERAAGPPRTYLALQKLELVDFRDAAADNSVEGADPHQGDATALLRVTLREAVLLTAAQNFARELRLVPRTAGEVREVSPLAVSAHDLHP